MKENFSTKWKIVRYRYAKIIFHYVGTYYALQQEKLQLFLVNTIGIKCDLTIKVYNFLQIVVIV